jgi:hypothetical protein
MKILLDLICGALFKIGGSKKEDYPLPGKDKKPARTIILPLVLAGSLAIYAKSIIPLLCIGTYQTLRLGYGEKSVLRNIFKTAWLTRAAYGAITSLAGASPLLFCGLKTQNYILYALVNAGVSGVLNFLNAPVAIQEIGQGLCTGLILFL